MKKSKKALLAASLFSAALNLNGCVYGPPASEPSSLPTSEADTTFSVSSNVNECVYGPPPTGILPDASDAGE